jgi:MFS family permease
LYLCYKFFGALFFAYPIFYQFATQSLSPAQVGLFFSAIGVFGFVADVPTGIVADKYGRKLCGLIGVALLTIAPLVVLFGHAFMAYMFAAFFYGMGRAFLSGALESLVYDHASVEKNMYRRINGLEITYGQAGILVSAALGGFLFSINQDIPFIAEAIASLICMLIIIAMQEQRKEGHAKPSSSHIQHLTQSARYLFATQYLRVVLLMGVVFSVMLGMCIQFVNEATMISHGLDSTMRGLVVSGAGTAALVALNLFLLKRLQGDTERIVYLSIGAVVAYACMSAGLLPLFFFGYFLWACLNATSSFIRLLIQDQIPSSHRSTIMSGFKTLATAIGLVASTATGLLVQWAHTPNAAYVVFGGISLFVVSPCALWLAIHIKKQPLTAPEAV